MSLYQKYRPKVFDDVLTQVHVTNILKSSIKKNDVGHAYLFVGTRGSGKTSIARILGRAINCQDLNYLRKEGNPCNSCDSCRAALSNVHPDIIEMDAASNRGIEEIRQLKDSIAFLPSFGGKKVYIIDEIHMMTKEAFNALLKTLEEPPEYVTFIMCTTELHKVPLTIISRSQVFEFKPATDDDLFNKIKYILNLENKSISDDGIKFIVKLSKGSFRDAESILDKVLRQDNSNVTYDELLEVLGYSNYELIKLFKSMLYERDIGGILNFANQNLNEGNILNFNYQLCLDIFDDIVGDTSDPDFVYKLSLFSFLTKLEKELKGSLVQKNIYMARILKYLIKSERKRSETKIIKEKPNLLNSNNIQDFKEQNVKNINKNLRNSIQRNENNHKILNEKENQKDLEGDREFFNIKGNSDQIKSSEDLKQKFLDFLKSKNLFLYKHFSVLDFSISNGSININLGKKEDDPVLQNQQLWLIILEFSKKYNRNLTMNLIQSDNSNKKVLLQNKLQKSEDKKLKDLTDQEIIDILKD